MPFGSPVQHRRGNFSLYTLSLPLGLSYLFVAENFLFMYRKVCVLRKQPG